MIPMVIDESHPILWFVWVPGEDAPQMHKSLESASAEADLAARMHVGHRVNFTN
jgi:hypothetical protein